MLANITLAMGKKFIFIQIVINEFLYTSYFRKIYRYFMYINVISKSLVFER